ncbi:Gx transporter family protein [Limisalsivibrio acetivorans]|uniref:Gx transporter family protein n=1 Tax=Limisalsivibrio acetivorans TaxID=1304888 RepID=UPI0003B2F1E7|nr:Gx transporter family protein [Limisalsivibrio acetivorans]
MQYQDRIARIGVYAALTLVLGVVENMIPLPLPGVRLGLSNIGIMLAIWVLDAPAAFTVALIKSVLVPLLTGNMIVKLSIGLPATMAAAFFMLTYHKFCVKYISPVSMGALGGFVHICIQFVMVNTLYIRSHALYALLPWFAVIAVLTGTVTGYLTLKLLEHAENSTEVA